MSDRVVEWLEHVLNLALLWVRFSVRTVFLYNNFCYPPCHIHVGTTYEAPTLTTHLKIYEFSKSKMQFLANANYLVDFLRANVLESD